jgi:hypothetical protein
MFVWTISDVVGLTVLGIIAIMLIIQGICNYLRHRKCKHDKDIFENQACDAICLKCGKNLGFIGNLKR